MKLFYSNHFVLPLPAGHRFPMEKYALLRDRLLASGRFSAHDVLIPDAASDEELARAHDPCYIRRVQAGHLTDKEMKQIGFPWSPEMVERSRRSAGATLGAVRRGKPCRTAWQPIWRAAPTMPIGIGVRASASSTMPPSRPS